jgi:hypothetical protein
MDRTLADSRAGPPEHLEHFETKGRPFPIFSIALVQSETEMLHAPAHDLGPMLTDCQNVAHTLFTERTFSTLFDPDAAYDCIVIGHNAIHESEALLRALTNRLPHAGLCILYQHGPGSLDFMVDDIGLRIERSEHDFVDVEVAAKLDPDGEVLLNWPNAITGPVSSGAGSQRRFSSKRFSREQNSAAPDVQEALMGVSAVRVLRPTPNSEWRTICEAEDRRRRLPVLVRTRMTRRPAVAATTMMLEPRNAQHRNLLLNMIMWCAGGRPDVAVVHSGGEEQASKIVRKLWMQGSFAIRHEARTPEQADSRSWPLRGVPDIVLTDGTSLERTDEWLRGGGRLIHLEDDGLRIEHRQTDARWVMDRWAAWFQSVPSEIWHGGNIGGRFHPGSVFATRAVLWTLREIRARQSAEHGTDGAGASSLPLPAPESFTRQVREMLRIRFGRHTHLERTIAQTVAAIDVDDLLGGNALEAAKRDGVEAWLEERFASAAPDNKLDILRALAPNGGNADRGADVEELANRVHATYGEVGPTISAVLMTKIREAAVQLGAPPSPETVRDMKWSLDVDPELDTSLLLASEYLIALHEYRNHGWEDAEQIGVKRATIDRALMTLARYGRIRRDELPETAGTAELISTEARALMVYFDAEPTPTHVIARDTAAVSPHQLISVLRESERLRAAHADAEQNRRTVRFAAPILTAAAVLISALLLWVLIAKVGGVAKVIAPIVAAPIVLALLLLGLEECRLGTVSGGRLGRFVVGGVPGVQAKLAAIMDEREASNKKQ